jgi:aminoglycoside phosphotransferase family enzyme/predicted kinase
LLFLAPAWLLQQLDGQAMSNFGESEKRLIDFLKSPHSYPHRPESVLLIETHISRVFIASPFVFKVKKPVNLGFADFSSLEKRRYFCERELQLNRRLSPEVYLDVLPIYKNESSLSFDPRGEIAEYALKMRQLPRGWFLDELLARGAVGENEIQRIVARLHTFYAAEKPTDEIESWGRPEKLKVSTDENFAQVQPFVGRTVSATALETIRHFTNRFYASHQALFKQRIQQRRILDCHGDLRLDHIHITPEAVTIFDCIEFNDRFRFIDLANDLAFLAMDFDFENRRDLANSFLQSAARQFGDPGILQLGSFYKCYRAVVRAKVESIQAISQHAIKAEEHADRAARYFRLALRYAIAGSTPILLVIMGRVGTGKSTVARHLGHELDWPVFASDKIRKQLLGLPLMQRTPPERRAHVYSEEVPERTYQVSIERGLGAAKEHGGGVLDATFSRRAIRDRLRAECESAGIRLQMIELEAADECITHRLSERETARSEISDARAEDFAKLSAAYEPATEQPGLIKMSTDREGADTAKAIMLRLAERNSE